MNVVIGEKKMQKLERKVGEALGETAKLMHLECFSQRKKKKLNKAELEDIVNAQEILNALAKMLEVDAFGMHCYNGFDLFCCGLCNDSTTEPKVIELLQYDRFLSSGQHSISWHELPLPRSFRPKVNEGAVTFRPYQPLSLEDVAYHLKMHLADVEAVVAKTLLRQALGKGIYANNRLVKVGSLEELFVEADLNEDV